MSILIALASLGGLTLLLVIMLIVANKKLYVYEDPRIEQVGELLPQANCGACGLAGCGQFAESLVGGKVQPALCSVNTPENLEAIASLLGVGLGEANRKVARLACAGGSNVAVDRAHYEGIESCQAMNLIGGGPKACSWGCLGQGDCAVSCNFDAIEMNANGLPVVNENKCTGCGDCVSACPKALFEIVPQSESLWVACKNLEKGDQVLAHCEVGCSACGKCEMDAPAGLITMEHHLPVIHHQAAKADKSVIDRCSTGAILWFDPQVGPLRGDESRKIIRKGAKPVQAT